MDRLQIQTGEEVGIFEMEPLPECSKVLLCSPVSKEEEEEAANGKKGKKGKGKGKEEKRPTTPMWLKDRASRIWMVKPG